jgi:glycosyltransferase involved in cell wall biosynthesis
MRFALSALDAFLHRARLLHEKSSNTGAVLKRVLMVAYHFPPLAGSSGIQRTLRFAQHLPALGWQLVLTADPRAYEKTSADLMAEVPADMVVRRAFALDTARHLTIQGRYMAWMARPDRWVSWKFAAIREGRKLIRQFKPDVIWSTYPIATAHTIALALHRGSGIPWVADFRDPMAQPDYPPDPVTRNHFLRIEAHAAQQCAFCVFTTPGAAADYRQRYPVAADRMIVLENGYDEDSFASAGISPARKAAPSGRPLVLLHSGIVYPSERDPTQLFAAVGQLLRSGRLQPDDLRLRFRASVHDDLLRSLAQQNGIDALIELAPAIAYREALAEMVAVDGLLVMQASNCNAQIPAKIYEYLRAGKPILGLTDPFGDTAGVLRAAGLSAIARIDAVDDICEVLMRFLSDVRQGTAELASPDVVQAASRQGRSRALADLLDRAMTTAP